MSTFIGIGADKVANETTVLLNSLKNDKTNLESQVKELTAQIETLIAEKAELENQVNALTTDKDNKKTKKDADKAEE